MVVRFFTILLFNLSCYGAPQWFGKIEPKPYEVVGYGEADNQKEARARALEDIASKLKVKIDSSFVSATSVEGAEVSSAKSSNLRVVSDMDLYGVRKLEETEFAGKWYVAYSYDNRPFVQKFVSVVGKSACRGKTTLILDKAPLHEKLTTYLGCQPKINITSTGSLYKLYSDDYSIIMDEEAIGLSLVTIANANISIEPSKIQVKNGESVILNIKSKNAGYITIFDVYSDGRVSVLLPNHQVKANSRLNFPDDIYKNIELSLNSDNSSSMDMFVVVLTDTKIDLSRYEIVKDEQAGKESMGYSEVKKIKAHQF